MKIKERTYLINTTYILRANKQLSKSNMIISR